MGGVPQERFNDGGLADFPAVPSHHHERSEILLVAIAGFGRVVSVGIHRGRRVSGGHFAVAGMLGDFEDTRNCEIGLVSGRIV